MLMGAEISTVTPGIHVLSGHAAVEDADGRDEPGHDERESVMP